MKCYLPYCTLPVKQERLELSFLMHMSFSCLSPRFSFRYHFRRNKTNKVPSLMMPFRARVKQDSNTGRAVCTKPDGKTVRKLPLQAAAMPGSFAASIRLSVKIEDSKAGWGSTLHQFPLRLHLGYRLRLHQHLPCRHLP